VHLAVQVRRLAALPELQVPVRVVLPAVPPRQRDLRVGQPVVIIRDQPVEDEIRLADLAVLRCAGSA
jgi:hypothetical protein